MIGMITDISFDLKSKEEDINNDAHSNEIINRDLTLYKIQSDHLLLLQTYFKVTENYQVSQRNRTHPYEALFGGKSGAGLTSINLGELKYGVSTEEQLLKVFGDNNKEGEDDAEEVEATLMECRVTLDRANNNDNANNARLNITFSYDLSNDECQNLEELKAHKNSHLGGVRPEEANSCPPCKRQLKCVADHMDHIM